MNISQPVSPFLSARDERLLTGIAALTNLLRGRRFAVLTGAGISVDSGIPDYRGPLTRHIPRNPVQHDEFLASADARRQYWSRASRGYAAIGAAQPNPAHRALADLESAKLITGIITQNVDGLHLAAGSRTVIELHGRLRIVRCLACAKTYSREAVQSQIAAENPGFIRTAERLAPDGDADVHADEQERFVTPQCPACRGSLMPDVVFFGGAVPKTRSDAAYELLRTSEALLVLGSSLTVYSGYRFVREAERLSLPIGIVTLGDTRGHRHAQVALDASLGEVLPVLAKALQ